VLTVYRDWKFLIGHTRVSATEGHVGLPARKSCSFSSENLVISFITRGDITWQESSQCVTESSPSARTCRLSVVRDAQRQARLSRHAVCPSCETCSVLWPAGAGIRVHDNPEQSTLTISTICRTISYNTYSISTFGPVPTLYGVLPTS